MLQLSICDCSEGTDFLLLALGIMLLFLGGEDDTSLDDEKVKFFAVNE
jgi:hypothetical protein